MRKIILSLLFLVCLLVPAAALADAFTFANQGISFTVSSDTYTIITADNLSGRGQWLESRGLTADGVLADFDARGVLLQAWSKDGDMCIEVSAVQDQYGQQLYDVNTAGEEARKNYRLGHSSDKTGEWRALGYDYTSAQWKNYKGIQRFLVLEYTRTVNGQTYRGYARKTVRNGWHINVECQVYDRSPKKSDSNALETLLGTWEFKTVAASAKPGVSASSSGSGNVKVSKVIFTSTPPAETNTGKFTVAGTGSSGLKVIGVIMRMSSSDVHRFESVIDSKGKFTMDVKLPKEGLWTMTYTVFQGEEVVEEGAFDAITFDDTLLTVSLNTDLPKTMALTGNSLTISGVTMKQTTVQCIVDGRYNKAIKTNNSGAFSFTFDTKEEGVYNITLVFEKKGYTARRFRCEAVREYTEEDRKQAIREDAIKPAYKTLTSNLSGKNPTYRGRYMVYTLNIKEVSQGPVGYLTFAGMSKTKSGVYKDLVVIRTTEQPVWREGTSVRMYLKCLGQYEVVDDAGAKYYPYFDLQWIE